MLNKSSNQLNDQSNGIIISKRFDEGDVVRLKFDPGLYGIVSKKGLVDQRNGQPLLEVTWFLQYNIEKEELETINPIVNYCSKESLSLLNKKEILFT